MDELFKVKKQVGPCGITCGTCFLGDGTMAEANKYINMSGIKEWGGMIPGGTEINWPETEKALKWMNKYAYCAGCEEGGGPPDCAIRVCANEKGYDLCSKCTELDTCEKLNWLGEPETIKENLHRKKGKTKGEIADEALRSS